jgi:hypothetical protein
VEVMHFENRKHILKYDDVANEQRKVIYKFRNDLMDENYDISSKIKENREEFVEYLLAKAEIYEALNAFKCQDKSSKLVKIIGGNVDAFSKDEPDNNTTPSELLRVAVGDRPTIGYDEFANNKTFIDSLNTHNNDITITEAQFSVGIKPIEKYLYQNDTIHIGNYELGQYARFRLYGRDEDSVYSLWNRDILISNGERVIQAKLSDINLTNGDNSAIYNIFNKGYNLFDILIQNDTSVDFTYLNMCIK